MAVLPVRNDLDIVHSTRSDEKADQLPARKEVGQVTLREPVIPPD
jgi:hypothetical protein